MSLLASVIIRAVLAPELEVGKVDYYIIISIKFNNVELVSCECPLPEDVIAAKSCSEKGLRNFPALRHRPESTAGISERAIRWKWKIAKCSGELGRRQPAERGRGGPGIRVHWPICSATTPAPGIDALSKYILVVPRTRRTLRHTPIFSMVQ